MSKLKPLMIGAAMLAAAAIPASAQDFNAAPNYGTINLRTGFTPDPRVVNLQSGGNVNAQRIDSGCVGFISNAPDVRLNFTGGSNLPLVISATSRADTTLVINAPDGRWYCNDDGGANGFNPSVQFSRPATGRYEIWVGTYGSSDLEAAQLHISELSTQ